VSVNTYRVKKSSLTKIVGQSLLYGTLIGVFGHSCISAVFNVLVFYVDLVTAALVPFLTY
jgi:hypothetical protein